MIERANKLGVESVVIPSISQQAWKTTIEVSETFKLPYALGLHPVFIDQHQPQHLSELDELLTSCKPIAVGEIGLDFYNRQLDREKQMAYFDKQLIIAKRHALPAIIHCRKAHDECLNALRETPISGGIIHAFNGSIQQAEKYMELGFLLGFGGMLTYARSVKLRALAKQIPLPYIALETDAPDMVVESHRGERNSPEHVPQIAAALAEIKNTTMAEVAAATTANVRKCLSL